MRELPVKYKPKLKSRTLKGIKVSNFTLVADFYPNSKRKNPKFTYRGDTILRELNSIFHNKFKTELEALLYKANLIKNDSFQMLLYDNSFPAPYSLVKKWHEGNEIFDVTGEYKLDRLGQLNRNISIPKISHEK